MVSNVVIRPLQKANCGDKGLFELHILIKVHRKMPRLGTQGRNLKVELEAESWRSPTYWLVLQVLLSWLSYTSVDPQNWHHPQLASFSHIKHKLRNAPTNLSTGQFPRGNTSLIIISSQICLGVCQVNKHKHTHLNSHVYSKHIHIPPPGSRARQIPHMI